MEETKPKKSNIKTFYERHPEKQTESIICKDCGQPYKYFNKSKHNKTKIHKLLSEERKKNQ